MPATFDFADPDGNITDLDDQAVNETPPELLAIQASPAIVKFAERTHQAFLDSLQSKLTITLGCDTRTAFIRTEQASMARYVTDAEPGIHKVVLSLEPLAGCAVLRFSSELLFKALDILLAEGLDNVFLRHRLLAEAVRRTVGNGQVFFCSKTCADAWMAKKPGA